MENSGNKVDLFELPRRIFLDTSTLQSLQRYGEFIYDGGCIDRNDKIWKMPDGIENVEALRNIMIVGRRAEFELALSNHSFDEVIDSGNLSYLEWAFEVLHYWNQCLGRYEETPYEPFAGDALSLADKLDSRRFGFLSRKDCLLVKDAVLLECDAFMTIDKKLVRNRRFIEKELDLRVIQPVDFWEMLLPWAALFA